MVDAFDSKTISRYQLEYKTNTKVKTKQNKKTKKDNNQKSIFSRLAWSTIKVFSTGIYFVYDNFAVGLIKQLL